MCEYGLFCYIIKILYKYNNRCERRRNAAVGISKNEKPATQSPPPQEKTPLDTPSPPSLKPRYTRSSPSSSPIPPPLPQHSPHSRPSHLPPLSPTPSPASEPSPPPQAPRTDAQSDDPSPSPPHHPPSSSPSAAIETHKVCCVARSEGIPCACSSRWIAPSRRRRCGSRPSGCIFRRGGVRCGCSRLGSGPREFRDRELEGFGAGGRGAWIFFGEASG